MHKMDLNSVDLNYVASTLSAKRMAQSARLQHTTDWQTYILTHTRTHTLALAHHHHIQTGCTHSQTTQNSEFNAIKLASCTFKTTTKYQVEKNIYDMQRNERKTNLNKINNLKKSQGNE